MPKLIDLTGKKFAHFIILGRDYETQKIKKDKEVFWYCQCDCGNKFSARGHDIRDGKILSCGCLKKENAKNINAKNLIGQHFGLLTVLYKCNYLKDNHYVWHCKCNCGNEKDILGKYLTTGQVKSCGCIKSNGESLILSLLQELNIHYEYQKKFIDCIAFSLPIIYDFYLPDYNIIIEYNGIQHYQPVEYFGGKERFIKQQQTDEIKRKWCKEKQIKFIEIPYIDFNKINKEYIKNLIKGD